MKRKLAYGASAVLALLAGWAFYYEPSRVVVHRFEIELPAWPEEADGLEVALLSDLHAGSPYYDLAKVEEVVRRTNEAAPDLVLLLGDYVIHGVVGGEFIPPRETASVLQGLEAPLGVFAVLGNHDWWYDAARVRDAFAETGIAVLEDDARRVRQGRFDFWLVGLGDWREAQPDVRAVVEFLDDGAPILVFTHNPDVFPEIPERVALTLAGHTHGGQVRFPFVGAPIVPSAYGQRYARGHVVEDERHLFVTTGLGTSIVPVRFGVPPEIALLTIRFDRSLPQVVEEELHPEGARESP